MVQRPNSAGVFSGDFNGGKSAVDPLTALQRTFVGSIVPLEIFQVTNTSLGPKAFCEFLRKFNPGEYLNPSASEGGCHTKTRMKPVIHMQLTLNYTDYANLCLNYSGLILRMHLCNSLAWQAPASLLTWLVVCCSSSTCCWVQRSQSVSRTQGFEWRAQVLHQMTHCTHSSGILGPSMCQLSGSRASLGTLREG